MTSVSELMNQYSTNFDDIATYSDYIGDAIMEVSDNLVNVYYNQLIKWANSREGGYWMEEAINQLGRDGCGLPSEEQMYEEWLSDNEGDEDNVPDFSSPWYIDGEVLVEMGYSKYIMTAQYVMYSQEAYDNLEDIIKYCIFYKVSDMGFTDLTDDQVSELEALADDFDNNSLVSEIYDAVEELLR